jgi:hypothetical protein
MNLANDRVAAALAEGSRAFGRRPPVLPKLSELFYSGRGPHGLSPSKGELLSWLRQEEQRSKTLLIGLG